MRPDKLIYILFLISLSVILFSCGDDEDSMLVGTWVLSGYESKVEAQNADERTEIEDNIKARYLFPVKGTIYIFEGNGTVTCYPNGTSNKGYIGSYTYTNKKLNVIFSFGGGLEYHDMDVDLSNNQLRVYENVASTYSSTYTSLKKAIRIHHLVRK